MGFTNTSPKGGPVYVKTPTRTVQDLNRLREFVEQVGNRIAGTAADRSAFTPNGWPGLEWQDTDQKRDTWSWFDGAWVAQHRLDLAPGPLFNFEDASIADITEQTKTRVRTATWTSDRYQRVMVVAKYQWSSAINAAGYDELRIGGITIETSQSITGNHRQSNEGASTLMSHTLVGTVVLKPGGNIVGLFASADDLGGDRRFRNLEIKAFPL